jgi:hypothetical protein
MRSSETVIVALWNLVTDENAIWVFEEGSLTRRQYAIRFRYRGVTAAPAPRLETLQRH